ncbi:hypothetical protein WJX74_005579 [Apatococcus lobatus]|uniref:glutathione-specific gamma-glutamylcyclotransferase n=2 Tax=Apatococcus TaxID=904362 RepID=A0AAW1TAJ8_9CHLO
MVATDTENVWIFGFGSLIHKAGFEYAERLVGYIKGYRVVWHQGSTDHRGTPEAPGRVVTILPAEKDRRCWGAAYRLCGSREQQEKTLKYLEWREKQYDQRAKCAFFTTEDDAKPRVQRATVFIATSNMKTNPLYLGPAALEDIAQQISTACGPSGDNCDYVYALAESYLKMGLHDEELEALASRVQAKRAEAGHHDDRRAACSSRLHSQAEHEDGDANGTT